MKTDDPLNFIKYLDAKIPLDNRSLNQNCWRRFLAQLKDSGEAKLLDIGAGTGSMLLRLLQAGITRDLDYRLLDAEQSYLVEAQKKIISAAEALSWGMAAGPDKLVLSRNHCEIQIRFLNQKIFDFLETAPPAAFNLILSHAFMDLFPVQSDLLRILSLLSKGGTFYFSIIYDGFTHFYPEHPFDAEVLDRYHRTMTETKASGMQGTLHAGTQILGNLARNPDIQNLECGASDWIIFPQGHRYSQEQSYFLHFIVDTIYWALKDGMDTQRLNEWISARHLQIDQGRLIYSAHQLDILGRKR